MRGPGLLVEFADVKNRLVESGKDEGKEEQRGMDLKCVGFFFFFNSESNQERRDLKAKFLIDTKAV